MGTEVRTRKQKIVNNNCIVSFCFGVLWLRSLKHLRFVNFLLQLLLSLSLFFFLFNQSKNITSGICKFSLDQDEVN